MVYFFCCNINSLHFSYSSSCSPTEIKYDKTIDEFLTYLTQVGEHLEEYEKCSHLVIQQKKYKKWLTVNLETARSIAKLLNNLKLKHDNKENN